jgi:hypothetical protein
MMIVSNQTRRIKEHRIYAGNLKTLLAQAEVSRFKAFEVGTPESSSSEICYLPESVKLDWKRDQLTLDVLLQDVTINQFEPAKAAVYFVEPVIPGYERVNLTALYRAQETDRRATVRRTLPPPEPRNGVKLGRPSSVSDESTTAGPLGSAGAATDGGRTTSQLDELVRAAPRVTAEPDSMRAATAAAWSTGGLSPIAQ